MFKLVSKFLCVVGVLFFSKTIHSQSYVDLVQVSYGQTAGTNYTNGVSSDPIRNLKGSITYPIPINEKTALLTGFNVYNAGLNLVNNSSSAVLNSFTLKVGYNTWHSDRWGSSILLLPKIAGSYKGIDSEDVFFGGLALANYRARANLTYRFGVYASSEPFGSVVTPIVGLFYHNSSKTFQADLRLPVSADVVYNFEIMSLGFSFNGTNTGYNIEENQDLNLSNPLYVQNRTVEITPYLRKAFLKGSLLLDAKVGYSTNSYQLYEQGDRSGLNLFVFESNGRRRLIEEWDFNGSLLFQMAATYRFYLK